MSLHTVKSYTLGLILSITTAISQAGQLPPLDFKTLEGEPITLNAYQGEVRLINFWATWCPPCIREMPALGRLEDAVKGHARVVAINVGDMSDQVEAFVLENFDGAEPEIWLDEPGAAFTTLRLEGLPMTLVLDKQGEVIDKVIGEREWDSESVVNYLKELAAE
jgi:thiol-disulfide isomerase/thioredoxin